MIFEQLPDEWIWTCIKKVVHPSKYSCVGGPFGSKLSRKHYVESPGVPVIRGSNLGNIDIKFIDKDFVFVSTEKSKSLKSNMAYPGDLIFTQRGTLGQVGWIPKKSAKYSSYIVSQSQMKVTIDNNLMDTGFVYFYFSSPDVISHIKKNAITTGVPHINLRILKNFPIVLPPLPEQRRIAAVLGALDDKIALNREMNRTLEELAQALFQRWFVDFDGHDDLVDSELGPVPSGWSTGPLSELVVFNPSLKLKKGTLATYVGMKALPESSMSVRLNEIFPRKYSSGRRFQQHDTLMARITPSLENGKTAFVDFLDPHEVAWGSTEFLVMRARKDKSTPHYIYCLARSPSLRAYAIKNMTGSSGRQRVSWRSMERYIIPLPPFKTVEEFSKKVEPFFEKIRLNNEQSQTLAELRDALLPRLISGELRVPHIEGLVEDMT